MVINETESKRLVSNPLAVVLQLVGAKWKFLIIQALLKKEMRFSELKEKIGCTSKALVSCLRDMEEDGLVVREERNDFSGNKIEYYLTDIGYTLFPVIEAMQKWGKDYKRLRKLLDKNTGVRK